MLNIEATKIEKGIVVNPAKKVKISKWEELTKNAEKVDVKVVNEDRDIQPEFNTKPEWEVVNTSFENVDVENAARPIRVAGESFDNIAEKGNKFIEESNIELPKLNDVGNMTLEDYTNKELSDAFYAVVNTPNEPEFGEYKEADNQVELGENEDEKEPNFEIPKFEEYNEEDNNQIEVSNTNDENESEFETMISKMVEEAFNKEETWKVSNSNLEINDLMREYTQLSEANASLKASIVSIEGRRAKMEKSIAGIEKETDNYNKNSLIKVKELILKEREEQQVLEAQKENAISTVEDLKARLISADEANLSAKKRSDYLKEMLSEQKYQPEEDDHVKTFAA